MLGDHGDGHDQTYGGVHVFPNHHASCGDDDDGDNRGAASDDAWREILKQLRPRILNCKNLGFNSGLNHSNYVPWVLAWLSKQMTRPGSDISSRFVITLSLELKDCKNM